MESSGITSLGSITDEKKNTLLDAAVELDLEEMWAVNTAQCNNSLVLTVESGSEGKARYQAYDRQPSEGGSLPPLHPVNGLPIEGLTRNEYLPIYLRTPKALLLLLPCYYYCLVTT
jgi:hypothetical protein